jgi:hypothetical protein
MQRDSDTFRRPHRRSFLAQLSAASASGLAVAAGGHADGAESPAAAPLPSIQLGEHRVTRLVAGWNPIGGYSYMGPTMDRHMLEYFTPERIVEFLERCEAAGINAHQFSHPERMIDPLRSLRSRGSKMKLICLLSGGEQQMPVEKVVESTAPIAIVHHGGVTDRLFRDGKSGEVHDFVKRVRDAGVLAGVSAHNPDCIRRIADEGWPVDFFMTCFYFLTRSPEQLAEMPAPVTVQIGYSFFADDPAGMTEVVRQVKQPCLGFKILAAGRKGCDRKLVEEAFRFAFEHIKPTDGVIVGMYPRYRDEVQENAQHVRQFGS